jgi:PAS domain S-box-containing protein
MLPNNSILSGISLETDPLQIKKLLKALPIPIVCKQENLVELNSAASQMLGYDTSAITTLEDWQQKVCAGQDFSLKDETKTFVLFKQDLSHCFVEITVYSNPQFEFWILKDVSSYLRMEQQAKDKEKQLANIIDSAMDAIITVDRNQNIILFNKAAEIIFGYSAEEILGKPLDILIPSRFHTAHRKHVHNFEKTGISNRRMGHLGMITGIRITGEEFPLEASISHLKTSGQFLNTVILRDITERKRLEEQVRQAQEDRLARKQELLMESYKKADLIFSALVEYLPNSTLDGKYRLEEKIGKGGYGVVYRAMHLALNRLVAVKIFNPIAANESKENLNRFRLEGISTCRVNHPNAVSILDSGISPEGIVYLVMELLEGQSLATLLDGTKTLSIRRCLEILIPTCNVLAEAHRSGIIHRDIKPDNIFLHRVYDGEMIKVVDFGIAKFLDRNSATIDLENLTVQGIVLGTPVYMAPERFSNIPYDGRSDVYSVGVMFYQMLCGYPPFELGAGGIFTLAILHLSEPHKLLREIDPNIPIEIEELISRLLNKDPNSRPTAEELSQELQKLLSNIPENTLNYNTNKGMRSSSSNTDTVVI